LPRNFPGTKVGGVAGVVDRQVVVEIFVLLGENRAEADEPACSKRWSVI
jgi:hypothetical protein